jgi:Fe-S oxidoreductase
MREIAEEACAMVQEYKGAYSGEHGDGLVRSEWIERMYGPRLTASFAALKEAFDPRGLMNPGKIVNPSKMDDRSLFRYQPGYSTIPLKPGLDWSEHEVGVQNIGRGFAAAVEMCNNNGHCRKFDAGTMCPSYRATRDEKHLTRGRANTLRLALSGQLGPDALVSKELFETMDLCVGCKGCKRECPTGVDMARMKIEFLNQYYQQRKRPLKDRLIAHLPRIAPRFASFAAVMNLRNRLPGLASLTERLLGFSARRTLPVWRSDFFRGSAEFPSLPDDPGLEVALLPDTFNIYFEPDNLRAAARVLKACGHRVTIAESAVGERPLCCGRTYLAAGMVDEARVEAKRMLAALAPLVERNVPIIGLEPACLLTLRDELQSLVPGSAAQALGRNALTFEEFLNRRSASGELSLELRATRFKKALVHGHCHQKAFGLMGDVSAVLGLIPDLAVETIPSGCCGMAGAFGYEAEHIDVSLKMAEDVLLPAVRGAGDDTVIVADGTSCRHQIHDGTKRDARHVAWLLDQALS